MPNEIKNFQVWNPPNEVQDVGEQPLFECEYDNSWFSLSRPKSKLTWPTGWFWLALPWLFLIRKKLTFSLLEFHILTLAWGTDSGVLATKLHGLGAPPVTMAVLLYATFHLHLLLFTGALYRFRIWRTPATSRTRWATVLLSQLPLLLLFGFIWFMLWGVV